MRLRSLSKHLREQNWFAVGLDFVIVVFGVGFALAGQQALSDRQARADYNRAFLDLREAIDAVYYTSKERVGLTECRKARYRELGAQLLQTDTPWPGMAREYDALAWIPCLRASRARRSAYGHRRFGTPNWPKEHSI